MTIRGSGGGAARVARLRGRGRELGDEPTLDFVGYKLPSSFGEVMPRTSVHVSRSFRSSLVPLAVKVPAMAAEAGRETRQGAESDEESDGCDGYATQHTKPQGFIIRPRSQLPIKFSRWS
jgi:hypothetical protein